MTASGLIALSSRLSIVSLADETKIEAGTVIRAARRHLARLEEEGAAAGLQPDLFAAPPPAAGLRESRALAALRAADPEALSPREALELVFRLKDLDR